ADHNARINNFLNDPMVQWSAFAAFTDLIFNKSTFYSDLIPSQDDGHGGKKPQTIKLPSGGILMQSSRTDRPGTSQYYDAVWDGIYPNPTECNSQPPANQACVGLAGPCCPTTGGSILACCDLEKFLIANTSRTYSTQTKTFTSSNRTLDD